MPGRSYRVLPLTVVDIGNTILTASTSANWYVQRALDLSQFREATLLVRVHQFYSNVGSNGPYVTVIVQAAGQTIEDDLSFVGGSNIATSGAILSTNSTPYLFAQTFTTPFGGMVQVNVQASQGSSLASSAAATLSIDVVAKS